MKTMITMIACLFTLNAMAEMKMEQIHLQAKRKKMPAHVMKKHQKDEKKK